MASLDALLEAVKARDAAAVAALLDADAALVSARPGNGASPVLMAAYVGAAEVVAAFRARGVQLTVWEAAALGDTARLGTVLSGDASLVHAYSGDGWTPLHLACFFGHGPAAERLLAHGADIHARSADPAMRNTPLHAAIAGARSPALIDRLLAHGADVNAVAGGGVAPLHLAAARGDLALIDRLLAHGARTTPTDDGKTPADLATERGHPDAAERLLGGEGRARREEGG